MDKKLIILAAGLSLLSAPLLSSYGADVVKMPTRPNTRGFFVGASILQQNQSYDQRIDQNAGAIILGSDNNLFDNYHQSTLSSAGVAADIDFGYRYGFSNKWYLAAFADYQFGNGSSSKADSGLSYIEKGKDNAGVVPFQANFSMPDAYGFNLRLGRALSSDFSVYGDVGPTYGNFKLNGQFYNGHYRLGGKEHGYPGFSYDLRQSALPGYRLGLGFEYNWSSQVKVTAEYDYSQYNRYTQKLDSGLSAAQLTGKPGLPSDPNQLGELLDRSFSVRPANTQFMLGFVYSLR